MHLWDSSSSKFRRTNLNRASVEKNLINWKSNPFQNPILNHIWKFMPRFILWNTWKEQNNRIFNDKSSPVEACWLKIHSNIQETLHLTKWTEEDLKYDLQEQRIWDCWGFTISTSCDISKGNTFSRDPPLGQSPHTLSLSLILTVLPNETQAPLAMAESFVIHREKFSTFMCSVWVKIPTSTLRWLPWGKD